MPQRAVSEFFQSRKRQRPSSLKEAPTSSVLPEGQDEPLRKTKRMKHNAGSILEATSSVETGASMGKEKLLMSLKARHGEDSPAKSGDKLAQLDRMRGRLASYKSATLNLKAYTTTSRELSGKTINIDALAASSSKDDSASTSGQNCYRVFATPKKVQRNLFGDDDDKKTEPQGERLSVTAHHKTPPGMSPQKMKESLMHCSKIGELKERLAGYNTAARKLKEFKATNKTVSAKDQVSKDKETLEFEITSPVKTPRKRIMSPSPKKTPAYQRFQHLLHDMPGTLALPYKFRFLKEAFHCLDTVSSFLHNRKEIITFKRLKSSVQEMLNKNFTETQLAQIKTVFPFAYIFRREKNLPNHKVTPTNKNKWQLTVEVNTSYEADMKSAPAAPPARATAPYRNLSPAMLLERGRIFHASLLDLLLQHHQEFLEQLEPPVSVDPARITRWHPEFPLESVPDVPAAALPQPPLDETGGTARDVLERAHQMFSQYPHLRDTLEAVASPNPTPAAAPAPAAGPPGVAPEPQPAGPSGSQTAPAAARLPTGLLERIRAREAARQQRLMTRTPAESRRLSMLSRLPQLVRSLRATFVTERRAALPLEMLVSRLADSSRGLAECDDLGKHVELLVQEAPQFVQIMRLKSGTFVKMMKDVDVNVVVSSLEKKLEKQ